MNNSPAKQVVKQGDRLESFPELQPLTLLDIDTDKPLAILIHGFTSHGMYLHTLAGDLDGLGVKVLLFNYNSYSGITIAANSLFSNLRKLNELGDGRLFDKGFYLIAHSMGGLVAREFILRHARVATVKGLVMLGTPNDGTLTKANLLNYVIQYGEYLSSSMPDFQTAASKSARQMTKQDVTNFMDKLNQDWQRASSLPPVMTVSGGKSHLDFFENRLRNAITNYFLQRALKDKLNDGLVPERSVDMRTAATAYKQPSHPYFHHRTYNNWGKINHTNLTWNQDIALCIALWIRNPNRTSF